MTRKIEIERENRGCVTRIFRRTTEEEGKKREISRALMRSKIDETLETSPVDYRLAALTRRFTHTVIEGDGVDGHESIEIVLVRYIIAVPRDYVEGTVTLAGHEQLSLIFAYDLIIDLTILVPCDRRLKVSWVCQAVRSYALSLNRSLRKHRNLTSI